MDNENKPRWYFGTWSLIAAFLCIGPFMLPLVWTNPRFSKKSKIVIIAVILILTYFLTVYFVNSLKTISSYYQLFAN